MIFLKFLSDNSQSVTFGDCEVVFNQSVCYISLILNNHKINYLLASQLTFGIKEIEPTDRLVYDFTIAKRNAWTVFRKKFQENHKNFDCEVKNGRAEHANVVGKARCAS